jgi:hypothetical protein
VATQTRNRHHRAVMMERVVAIGCAIGFLGCGPAVIVDDEDGTTSAPPEEDDDAEPPQGTSPMPTTVGTSPSTSTSTSTTTSMPPADSSDVGTAVTTLATEGSSSGAGFCGDGVVMPGEQCDGEDLQDFDCEALGFDAGLLLCTEGCAFDTSLCEKGGCGDGMISPGEQCDGRDLQGFDCESLGLGEGNLACDPMTCAFDTSDCTG